MAEEKTVVKDEQKPEEKTVVKEEEKEKDVMAENNTDFRQAAKNAGYALVPEADLKGLNEAQENLKNLRAIFPEEARGKEGDYVKSLSEKASKVEELSGKVKSVEDLQKENETLKEQITQLAKSKKLSDMWGHVSKVQQMRNVYVDDDLIDENKMVGFEMEKHDLSKEDGLKKFTDSVWKEVLEPAYKRQQAIIERAGGGDASRGERDTDGKSGKDERDDHPSPWAFGARA